MDAIVILEVFAKKSRETPQEVIETCKLRLKRYQDLWGRFAMNRARKARLAAGGWRIGSAAEFLGLSKEEAAFVEMKLALARCLRELRIRRKLSQARVAELVGSSQSRVAKMESGDPSVTIDLLLRSVLAVGASPGEVARALSSRKKLIPA